MTTLAAILLNFLMVLSPLSSPVCDNVKDRDHDTASLREASAPTHNTTSAEIYHFHTDHLSSSAWITDSLGLAVQHLCYLPWGENWITQKNLQANLMFISMTEMLLILMEHGGITTKNMCLQIKKENF